MAVLSNLRVRTFLSLALLAALAPALCGCAGDGGADADSLQARSMEPAMRKVLAADERLIPPDLVWTLPDGARIPVRVWLPAAPRRIRAVVLALHGIDDSRDAWEIPGPALAADGIAIYGPDQRGFGEAPDRGLWAGADRLVDDAAAMVRRVRALNPVLPVYVMGESMGGAVTLCLAARPDHPPVAGFIALSPAVWSSTEMSPILTASLWAASTFAPDWQLTGHELPLHIMASDNLAALYRLSYDPLTLRATRADELRGLVRLMTDAAASVSALRDPVLVGYGAHDQIVPADAMAASWRRFPAQVRRAYYPNGYHLLLRDRGRQAVIGDVASWILDRSAPLPSGADIAAAAWSAGGYGEAPLPGLMPANLDSLVGGS